MGYSTENYRRVRETLAARRAAALQEADRRTEALHIALPQLCELDRALVTAGMQLFHAATGENAASRIAAVRAEHENLRAARDALLREAGYPADYTEPPYGCRDCRDTGFIEGRMCACMRRELVTEGIRSSGLGSLINKQSFENFSLHYYENNPEALTRARHALARARDYAESFGEGSGNLLLMGATGLGKTHLSTAIARTVIERGYDVVYESIQNVLGDFEYDRFKNAYGNEPSRAERYLTCDLLILDDLGTENVNQFVLATLYQLLNTRLNRGKQTVASTNVIGEELKKQYSERISSRLFGEFEILVFSGTDIRMQKK